MGIRNGGEERQGKKRGGGGEERKHIPLHPLTIVGFKLATTSSKSPIYVLCVMPTGRGVARWDSAKIII